MARLAPGFEQVAQLADVARSMTVFQTEVGQATLGTTLSSAGGDAVGQGADPAARAAVDVEFLLYSQQQFATCSRQSLGIYFGLGQETRC